MSGQQGREVVIVEAVRTPIGRGHPEKGWFRGHAPQRPARHVLHGAPRARRDRRVRGRGRHRRLRAAARRAGLERRAQRLAAGRAADRDGRDDRRSPVRLGAAGRELRRGAHRRRDPRRRHRLGRRAHGPHPDGRRLSVDRDRRLAVAARAHGEARARPAGAERRADRRAVGDPALGARRAGRPLAPPRARGDRGGPLRARDRAVSDQRHDAAHRPGHPARHEHRDARRSSSRRSSPTAGSRRPTRRRSPTARPPCC